MKNKSLIFTLLISSLLASCNTGEKKSESIPSGQEEEDYVLNIDQATSYPVDTNVTNENGSMSYEIFVRSFYDSDSDGIGDINGVTLKLDYLKDLGIKTIWLMPIMPSPSYHGYDVSNYYQIHEEYGTLADFENLCTKASQKGIDIMIDMVLNHCSRENPYFAQSYQDYKNNNEEEGSKKDWFNWSETTGGAKYSDLYYEARFDASMPDFNLNSEGVREEMEKIVKFWIDKGVKGFRLDAVLYYYYGNTAENVKFLTWLEDVAHKYDPNFYMVGECWQGNSIVNSYYSSKCDSFFRFQNAIGGENSFINISKGYGNASALADQIQKDEKAMKNRNKNAYSSYFLSNHDQDRISKNLTVPETYKAAATLYTLLPGTPFMYYGEEIALKGVRSTGPEDFSDVKRRLPMIWSKEDKTGQCRFPEKNRQDLNNTEQVEDGVVDQLKDNFSLLNHYRYMINVRNKYPFLKQSVFTSMVAELEAETNTVLAYKLSLGDEYIIVVHNFGMKNVRVKALGEQILDEINITHRKPKLEEGYLYLGAQSSVIIK